MILPGKITLRGTYPMNFISNLNILKTKIFFLAAMLGLLIGASAQALEYKLEFPLPGMPSVIPNNDPGQYIQYLFFFGLILAGFLAVAAIVTGGIMYMLGGTVTSVERAKTIIVGAITGVVLLLCSYLILATIDPTLTNLSPFKLPNPGSITSTTTTP